MAVERVFLAARPGAGISGDPTALFPFAVTGEDNLRLTSFCSVSDVQVTLTGRLRNAAGELLAQKWVHTCTPDRLHHREEFGLSEGVLVNLTAVADDEATVLCTTFVIVELIRGRGAAAEVMAVLLQGYVTSTQRVGWPGSPIHHSRDAPGRVTSVALTSPAAGAEFFTFVPPGAIWQLLGVHALLTTGAAVANREPSIVLGNGVDTLQIIGHPVRTAALSTVFYHWSRGAYVWNTATFPSGQVQGLPEMEFGQLYTIGSFTNQIQAADQWSQIQLTVREWLEGRQ